MKKCDFIVTQGKNTGHKCGRKASEASKIKGKYYCARHKNNNIQKKLRKTKSVPNI